MAEADMAISLTEHRHATSDMFMPIQMATLIDTVERMYRERGKLSPVGKLE